MQRAISAFTTPRRSELNLSNSAGKNFLTISRLSASSQILSCQSGIILLIRLLSLSSSLERFFVREVWWIIFGIIRFILLMFLQMFEVETVKVLMAILTFLGLNSKVI